MIFNCNESYMFLFCTIKNSFHNTKKPDFKMKSSFPDKSFNLSHSLPTFYTFSNNYKNRFCFLFCFDVEVKKGNKKSVPKIMSFVYFHNCFNLMI